MNVSPNASPTLASPAAPTKANRGAVATPAPAATPDSLKLATSSPSAPKPVELPQQRPLSWLAAGLLVVDAVGVSIVTTGLALSMPEAAVGTAIATVMGLAVCATGLGVATALMWGINKLNNKGWLG